MARGSRSQRRNQQRGDVLIFQTVDHSLRITKCISIIDFERLKGRGHCFRVVRHGGLGPVVGYEPVKVVQSDDDLASRQTTASITVREMGLIAGLFGKSRTAGLIDDFRDNRVDKCGRPLPPEDAIERAIAKLGVYEETRLR